MIAAVLDGRAETHDRERADHAEGDHDIAVDHQHDDDRDQERRDERDGKAPVELYAVYAPAAHVVAQGDNESDAETAQHDEQDGLHAEA